MVSAAAIAAHDQRLNVIATPNLAGLPPTMVVLAQTDPLRSGGEPLGQKLAADAQPMGHIRRTSTR